ncbi:MAG: apolipoprotein N-acyltransferase [Chitinispirillales bacterium]|jgi:apolipoprotein N-acyltransferase|nr:apolipoprotein N-acyltransferase [Chitinispirillales bacterium]
MLQIILTKISAYCGKPKRFWIPLLCGFAYSLCLPPFSGLLHPVFALMPLLSSVVLIPLFFFATRAPRRRAFVYSYIYCAAMILGQKYWIGFVTQEGLWIYILIGVVLISLVWGALYFTAALAFRYCAQKIPRMYIAVYPAIWVLIDFSRTLTDLAFPWSYIGYSATGILPLAQFSSFTGVWGLSYLIVLGNIAIWELLRAHKGGDREIVRQKWPTFGIWIALIVGISVWGLFRMNREPPNADTSKIALMQSYMDQFNWGKGSLDTAVTVSDSMIRVIENDNLDLIVFPESALLCYLDRHPEIRAHVFEWADRAGAPIMVGASHWERSANVPPGSPMRDEAGRRTFDVYNTVFLTENGQLTPYHKIMLVPFSEIMPFEAQFPIFSRVNLGNAGFTRGAFEAVFRINNNLELAPYICYEMIFPDFVRRRLRESTNLLVNVTNDGWFGRTSGPYQHAVMSQMRSIENGISMARAANSGISMYVDPHGRILTKTGLYTREIAVKDIPVYRIMTFYTRFGDWFVFFCAILTAFGILAGVIQKKRMGEITNPLLVDEQKQKLTPAGVCQSERV